MKIIKLSNNKFDKNIIKSFLEKKICFLGIFSKLCIHCQNMKKQWKFLKYKLKKYKCNGLLLEIDSNQLNYIDYSSLNNSIKGLPSIMIFKNGKLQKEYNGNRTTNDMFKFFKPYLLINNKTLKKNKRKVKKIKTKVKTKVKNKK